MLKNFYHTKRNLLNRNFPQTWTSVRPVFIQHLQIRSTSILPKFCKSTLSQSEHYHGKVSDKLLHELSRQVCEFAFSFTFSLNLQLYLCQEFGVVQLRFWVKIARIQLVDINGVDRNTQGIQSQRVTTSNV